MVDCGGADAADVIAGTVVVDDSVGAAAGGVPLSAAGARNTDCSVESGSDGTGVDDDLVSDAAGVAAGGADKRLHLIRLARSPARRRWIVASQPVKQYMLRYAREKDLAVFASAGMAARPKTKEDLPIQVVVPAYILSELKAGFQIGAVLFLPFLLVDLVVASVTTSIGMMQLPPVVISTPLKILLFVMVDGWNLLADQLIKSF